MKETKDEIIAYVYATSDYDKFKKLNANRNVLALRIKKLIESFSIRNILNPIIVNEAFEIVDGQGRYEARKALGLPIQYVVDPETTIDDCALLNTYNNPGAFVLH